MGFERVGCYLCPAALSAEYQRLQELHPKLYERWNSFLMGWANDAGLSEGFIRHGFWRWKELAPKMVKLSEELGIPVVMQNRDSPFRIDMISGISPCKAGGYSIEGRIHGFSMKRAANILNMIGTTSFSEELGLLLVRHGTSTVKLFSSASLVVGAEDQERAHELFREVSRQLLRNHKCTGCGICLKACPIGAIALDKEQQGVIINAECTRCGKCTDACVIMRYSNKMQT